jgi:hypothetical protein
MTEGKWTQDVLIAAGQQLEIFILMSLPIPEEITTLSLANSCEAGYGGELLLCIHCS